MSMIEKVYAKARADVKRIVLPEGEEERTLLAAAKLKAEGLAEPILLGKEETIRRRYSVGLHYLFRDFMPLCDRWILCDNSHDKLEIVAESSEAGITVRNPETFGKIKSVNYEYEKELREEGKKRNV